MIMPTTDEVAFFQVYNSVPAEDLSRRYHVPKWLISNDLPLNLDLTLDSPYLIKNVY